MEFNIHNFELLCSLDHRVDGEKLYKTNKVVKLTKVDIVFNFGQLYEGKLRIDRKIYTLNFLIDNMGVITTDTCPICHNSMCEHFIALFHTLKHRAIIIDKRVFSPLRLSAFHIHDTETAQIYMRECIERYKVNGKISDWYLPFCLDGVRLAMSCAEQTADSTFRIELLCIILYYLNRLYSTYIEEPRLLQDCIFSVLVILCNSVLYQSINSKDEEDKDLIFLCLYRLSKHLKDWLYRYRILKIMVYVVSSPSSIRNLQNLFQKYIATMPDKATEIKALYFMLLKKIDEPSAMDYMKNNINEGFFRCMAIDYALDKKNYAYAQQLIDEGILQDIDDKENLADWYRYAYALNKEKGRKAKMRSFAKKLIMLGDVDYYYHYKSLFNEEEWSIQLPKLIAQLQRKNNLDSIYIQIMIEENSQDRLLSYCVDHPKKAIGLFPYLESEKRPTLCLALEDYSKKLDSKDCDLPPLKTVIKKLKA